MGYKSLFCVSLVSLVAGFFIGRGHKVVETIVKEGETHEKVVYRDVVKNKVVRSIKTTTRPSETVLDYKEEFFVSQSNSNFVESTFKFKEETKIDRPSRGRIQMGFYTDFKTISPVIILPVFQSISIIGTTNIDFDEYNFGLIYSF